MSLNKKYITKLLKYHQYFIVETIMCHLSWIIFPLSLRVSSLSTHIFRILWNVAEKINKIVLLTDFFTNDTKP